MFFQKGNININNTQDTPGGELSRSTKVPKTHRGNRNNFS